jgi:hypothetical protein
LLDKPFFILVLCCEFLHHKYCQCLLVALRNPEPIIQFDAFCLNQVSIA